ncbi:MAG: alpha/beta hydrolase family protein [Hyphomicrobiales bacterium]
MTSPPEPFEIEGADGGPLRGDWYEPGRGRRAADAPSLAGAPPADLSPAAVVLCHGFRAYKDWGFLPPLAARLAEEGLAAVTFSFSGSGVSGPDGAFDEPERFRRNTYAAELTDLARVLDWAEGRLGARAPARAPARFGLAGHSRGGAIAILHAAHDPRVRCVATLAAPSAIMVWPDDHWEAWRRGEPARVYDFRTRSHLLLGPEILGDIEEHRARYDVASAVRALAAPLLVVQGDRDQAVPEAEGRTLAGYGTSAATEYRRIEGAGHSFQAGDRVRRTPAALLDMLEAVAAWMRRWLASPRWE